jgi:transposase-like protein
MALSDHDLSDLLAALKAGELTDPIRSSLEWVLLQQLIEAEATAVIGAGPHERSQTRVAHRNGHRPRLHSPRLISWMFRCGTPRPEGLPAA